MLQRETQKCSFPALRFNVVKEFDTNEDNRLTQILSGSLNTCQEVNHKSSLLETNFGPNTVRNFYIYSFRYPQSKIESHS